MDVVTKQKLIVGQTISVLIDDLLPDLILVSYQHPDSKIFQGILLDSTKRKVPCGIYATQDQLKPFKDDGQTTGILGDRLYCVSQRHTYNASNNLSKSNKISKYISVSKTNNSRMTVRLRPRQVLCSKCQSICNEKSENIGPIKSSISKETCFNNFGLSTKNSNATEKKSVRDTRQSIAVNDLHSLNTRVNSSPTQNAVLIPKLIKLKAIDIETATNVFTKLKSCGYTSVNISEVPLSSSETGNVDKIPIVKISNVKKGKIPKMTISTSSVAICSNTDKCGIRTRSKGSIEEKVLGLHASLSEKYSAASKVILPSMNSLHDGNEKQDMIPINLLNNLWINYSENICKTSNDCNLLGRDINSLTSIPSISENLPQVNMPKVTFPISLSTHSDSSDCSIKSDKMNLRKKRSVGLMEDLWDESIFDEVKKIKEADDESADCPSELETNVDSEKPKTTPVLKISFGPGKGTVLKIPAKSTVSENDSLNDVEEQIEPPKNERLLNAKAARKALKRARKEAQRKAFGIASYLKMTGKAKFSIKSPITLGGMSPARFSSLSPGRFGGVSPGRFSGSSPGRLSCSSPGRFGGTSPARLGAILLSPRTGKDSILSSQTRKHKHKVKHKKKHKEHKHKSTDENVEPNIFSIDIPSSKEIEPLIESTNVNVACSPESEKTPESSWKIPSSPHQATSPRHSYLQNTRHKLSISIKRVSNASYIACEPSDQKAIIKGDLPANGNETRTLSDASDLEDNEKSDTYKPMGLNCNFLNISPERDTGSDHSQSSDDNLEVPNFPYSVSRTSWQGSEGFESTTFNFKAGDVVWGKIQDFPWWPAKVVCIRISEEMCSSEPNYQQAQVNWYGTNATSLLPVMTLQPFLKQFNVIFNKRKRGHYLKAVRLASCEAKQIMEDTEQMVANICESPITASPREVDVVS